MFSKIPQKYIDVLTIRDLEDIIEIKKRNGALADLIRERDRLRLDLKRVEDAIERLERVEITRKTEDRKAEEVEESQRRSFLTGKRRKNLKDYIAQVLSHAGEPLSPAEIQRRLPGVGYVSNSTNPRSFYNTVFQALQRYEIFKKVNKKYTIDEDALEGERQVVEILPKKKTRLKDYIIQVLSESDGPLKVSEIASRVVIAGYKTDLDMDDLTQRVSATLKKYLNKEFDWDSQRYRLATQN